MRQTKWDTELGRKMWLEGKTDAQIADEFRISVGTVNSYRKKHWENGADAKKKKTSNLPAAAPEGETPEKSRQVTDLRKKMMDEVEPGTCQTLKSVPGVPGPLPPVKKKTNPHCQPADKPQDGAEGAGAGVQRNEPLIRHDTAATDSPEGEACGNRKFEIMEVVEAATEHLSGIMAVCTASAIENLMYWRYPEDLIRAKQSIDYLLKKLGAGNG